MLGVHGWGDLQPELNKMSKQGQWMEMGDLITDEMLNSFGVMGEPASVVPEIIARYGDFTDRTNGGYGFVGGEERVSMIQALRA